ncbi:gliding motility-associated protein GldN [Porphyromonas uenonis 60-3]|uniref:Gliding motility-associated protein GldN n=2 Tax=Porphyromonas uenonis 60-3 TaxID=596327 RepID=C2MAW6_9PORP|nr:gliding motility protein GldN [Porphyromonas uenonis]EEK17067.1 gliding motility-associated protein GldN [Porphyromonas uenonis 60-3]
MQRIQSILIVLLALTLTLTAEAQNFDPLSATTTDSTRVATELPRQRPTARQRRAQKEQETQTDGVSIRAKNYADQQVKDTETAPWRRVIYRQLSIDSLANAPIFRPVRPSGQLQSLFSLLFKRFNDGSITVYEYEDLGYENLTPERQLRFEDFLDRFGIVYDKDPSQTGNRAFKILPVDIPTQSIHNYYVKEEYYYDVKTSDVSSQIIAICPVMDDEISMEGSVRIPLFWVKYSDVQPYLSQQPIMLSTKNNATTATMDDFFSLNLYRGQISMTLGGETAELNSEMSDSTAMAARQAFSNQIEGELKQFEESLYGTEYTKPEASDSDLQEGRDGEDDSELDTARARRSQELREGKSQRKAAKVTKAKKKSRTTKKATPKAAKAEQPKQSKSTTTRSVRNRF